MVDTLAARVCLHRRVSAGVDDDKQNDERPSAHSLGT